VPKTISTTSGGNFSMQLTMAERTWLDGQRKERESVADLIRKFIRNEATLYGLPEIIATALREDMARVGKAQDEYIRDVLAAHFMAIQGKASGSKR
jgi:hypothetical protein